MKHVSYHKYFLICYRNNVFNLYILVASDPVPSDSDYNHNQYNDYGAPRPNKYTHGN